MRFKRCMTALHHFYSNVEININMGIFDSKKNVDFKSNMKSSHIPEYLPYQIGRVIYFAPQDLDDDLLISSEWRDMFDFKEDFGEDGIKKLCPEVCCNIYRKLLNGETQYSGFSLVIGLIKNELRCYIWDGVGDRTESFIDRMMYHLHVRVSDTSYERIYNESRLYRSLNEDLFVLAKVGDEAFDEMLQYQTYEFDGEELVETVKEKFEIINKIRKIARNIIEFTEKENLYVQ